MVEPISSTERMVVCISQRVHLVRQKPRPVTTTVARCGAFCAYSCVFGQIVASLARQDIVKPRNASTFAHLATFFTPLAACLTQTNALDRKCALLCKRYVSHYTAAFFQATPSTVSAHYLTSKNLSAAGCFCPSPATRFYLIELFGLLANYAKRS